MDKPAPSDHPICDLARDRWSPRAFGDRPVAELELHSLIEAARWSPSSRNSQPWRFIVARREDAARFARLLGCLHAGNQRWAGRAAVLLVAVAVSSDDRGRPLTQAAYDTGQAVAWLTCEATARGLRVHQMGGFDAAEVRARFALADELRPLTAIALGYPGDPQSLPDDLREQELAPRRRRPQRSLILRDPDSAE